MKIIDLLNEGRDSYLYHATALNSAIRIISSNNMSSKTKHIINGKKVTGISLTRDKNFAFSWNMNGLSNVVFVLNQSLLSQNKKIVPLDYYSTTDEKYLRHDLNGTEKDRRKKSFAEAEEFVIGSINNLDRYLVSISVKDQKTLDILNSNPEDYSILLNHPLFNKIK